MQLRFASFAVVYSREDLHLQDRAHAGRTTKSKARNSGLCGELSDDDLLSPGRTRLSSALARFTVLFEMGRSGSTPLWSSDFNLGVRDQQRESGWRFVAILSADAMRKK